MVFETLAVHDARLVVRVRGDGRPIILLHGFPDTFDTWLQGATADGSPGLEDRLAGAGFRTFSLAMRGYPPSDVPGGGDYSLRTLAGDVIAVLDRFGIERGLLIGHDWGASAAYAAAALHPDRIDRIVALAIPPFPVLPSGWRERLARPHNIYLAWGQLSAWLLRNRRAALVDRLYRTWSPGASIPALHIAKVREALLAPDRAMAAVGYYAAKLDSRDLSAIVRPVVTPTLVIHGDNEPASRRRAFAQAVSHLGPGSRVDAINGVGHWPHLEAPERSSALVADWIGRSD